MPAKPHKGPTTPSQFRLGEDTLAELDLIRDHLAALHGGRRNRTDAVRYAARQVAAGLRKGRNASKSMD